jgi:hypothetical protein
MQCILYEFISLEHNNTIQYNTDILFPIKEPFPVEQLTKNLIQWFMDWLHWLEDDNILWNKTSFDLCSPIT